MKVIFKLNDQQLVRAQRIAFDVEYERGCFNDAQKAVTELYNQVAEGDHSEETQCLLNNYLRYLNCASCENKGNLWSPYNHDPNVFNPNQQLDLIADEVCYEGERHPMIEDGAIRVISEIAGYSDLVSAFKDKFSRLKVVYYNTSDKRLNWWNTLSSWLKYEASWNDWVSSGETAIPTRFSEHARCAQLIKSNRVRLAYAEFPSQFVREVSSFINQK